MGHNLNCMGNITEMFAPSRGFLRKISPRFLHTAGGFRGRAIECCQTNSSTTNPCCHGNEIWDKRDYNSICI